MAESPSGADLPSTAAPAARASTDDGAAAALAAAQQRCALLEAELARRAQETASLLRDLRVSQAEARAAAQRATAAAAAAAHADDLRARVAALEKENAALRLRQDQQEHQHAMARAAAMLDRDDFRGAGFGAVAAAWTGATPSEAGGSLAAPPPSAASQAGGASGVGGVVGGHVVIRSSAISSLGFGAAPVTRQPAASPGAAPAAAPGLSPLAAPPGEDGEAEVDALMRQAQDAAALDRAQAALSASEDDDLVARFQRLRAPRNAPK